MDKKIIKNIVRALIGGLIVYGVWLIVKCHCIDFKSLTPAAVRNYILGFGRWSAVVYILAYALNTVSIFPPIGILSLTAGLAFGKVNGAVLLMAGAVLGSSITFFISRLFARAVVERIIRGKFKALDDLLEKKGFAAIFFFRLIPLVPYEALNYASGLSRIKFRDYILATFLGLIPGVLISAFFGGELGKVKGLKDLISFKFMLALSALALAVLIPVIYTRLNKKGGVYGK